MKNIYLLRYQRKKMKIILGTTSEIKQNAIQEVLKSYGAAIKLANQFQIVPIEVDSQVPLTPRNEETLQGARNRVRQLRENATSNGDLFVGLESGLVERWGMLFEECWCVVEDKAGKEFTGYSSGLLIPSHVVSGMNGGKQHLEIITSLAQKLGIKNKDTWAVYSHSVLSRTESIKEAFRNAFLSFTFND